LCLANRQKGKNFMLFDEQQNVDPSASGTPFDPYRQAASDQADDMSNPLDNRGPGQSYPGQTPQAAGQGPDALQQQQGLQGNPDMGNLEDTLQQQSQPGLGGMGEMLGSPSKQPDQTPPVGASGDPNNPYGNIDDTIANYGNAQNDPGQQGITNV
jgi:hypothetical protein